MPLDGISLELLTDVHLTRLVNAGVPEGLRLEYKEEFWKRNDEGTKEALKYLTAFANKTGGHIIVGINEVQGIPT